MAEYHNSIKVLGKSGGRSAVQFSAYMSGEKDHNDRTHETYDHTSKEEVAFSEMYFTSDVPEELQDRSKFWNALELHETSSNARFSRTWELALPYDKTITDYKEMVEAFKDELIKDGYCAVQVAIHLKEKNPHAHIMAPCRQMKNSEWEKQKGINGYVCVDKDGNKKLFASVKDIEDGFERVPLLDENGQQKVDSRNRLQWKRATMEANKLNSKELLISQRERWAEIENRYLAPEEQVSHLSYKAREIDRVATKHLGYTASQMEKKGIRTELGDYNRAVLCHNFPVSVADYDKEIKQQKKLIEKLEEELQQFLESVKKGATTAYERLLQELAGSLGQGSRADKRIEAADKRIEAADTDAFLGELETKERAAEKERENRDNEQKRLDAEREQSLREQAKQQTIGTGRKGRQVKELTSDYELS